MDNDATLSVQNGFFNQVRKDRTRVTIFLTNGQKVSGIVKAFDRFTLLVDTRIGDQIVFKHAIATVSTFHPADKRAGQAAADTAGKEHKFGNFIDLEGVKEP